MTRVWIIPVHDSTRVRDVRVATEEASARARLDAQRTAIAALVATELATNLLKHAGGGRLLIDLVDRGADARGPSVQLVALDHGPGIRDVSAAMRDGYTTSEASLGAGLGSCLRISSAFDLYSTPRGTVAVARIDQIAGQEETRSTFSAGGINISLAQADLSGDSWSCARSGSRSTLMLADGLGHGAKAAHASSAAVDELHRVAHLPSAEILRHLHLALRPTRGAAVAVAQLDSGTGELAFAGVGNIGARLHTAGSWQHLVSHPGIVGAHYPATVPVRRLPWRPGNLLVLHSDGLPSRWVPPADDDLLAHDPAAIAATILRDASSAASPVRDDTCVAVLTSDRQAARP
ncbi:ATP-binding SpoIIE family protein phosphatase [Streptomyces sp. NPDC059828]|uniref:ATP-binding SpoIIE family protein phosphatase n=1 Tax=Streptomyces sp. NPDC059828 TaxID=3346965 RepID=UPI00364EA79A